MSLCAKEIPTYWAPPLLSASPSLPMHTRLPFLAEDNLGWLSPANCTALGTRHGHTQVGPLSAPVGALALFSKSTKNKGPQAGKSDAL